MKNPNVLSQVFPQKNFRNFCNVQCFLEDFIHFIFVLRSIFTTTQTVTKWIYSDGTNVKVFVRDTL